MCKWPLLILEGLTSQSTARGHLFHTLARLSMQNSIDNMTIRTFCNFLHKQLHRPTHRWDGEEAQPYSIIAFGYNYPLKNSAISLVVALESDITAAALGSLIRAARKPLPV